MKPLNMDLDAWLNNLDKPEPEDEDINIGDIIEGNYEQTYQGMKIVFELEADRIFDFLGKECVNELSNVSPYYYQKIFQYEIFGLSPVYLAYKEERIQKEKENQEQLLMMKTTNSNMTKSTYRITRRPISKRGKISSRKNERMRSMKKKVMLKDGMKLGKIRVPSRKSLVRINPDLMKTMGSPSYLTQQTQIFNIDFQTLTRITKSSEEMLSRNKNVVLNLLNRWENSLVKLITFDFKEIMKNKSSLTQLIAQKINQLHSVLIEKESEKVKLVFRKIEGIEDFSQKVGSFSEMISEIKVIKTTAERFMMKSSSGGGNVLDGLNNFLQSIDKCIDHSTFSTPFKHLIATSKKMSSSFTDQFSSSLLLSLFFVSSTKGINMFFTYTKRKFNLCLSLKEENGPKLIKQSDFWTGYAKVSLRNISLQKNNITSRLLIQSNKSSFEKIIPALKKIIEYCSLYKGIVNFLQTSDENGKRALKTEIMNIPKGINLLSPLQNSLWEATKIVLLGITWGKEQGIDSTCGTLN